jgi:hypothetical protein
VSNKKLLSLEAADQNIGKTRRDLGKMRRNLGDLRHQTPVLGLAFHDQFHETQHVDDVIDV